MSKQIRGIHLYININNLNNIIRKEENNDEDLRHSFHALDSSFGDSFFIEKETSPNIIAII